MVPTTLIDDAELVWRLRDKGFDQISIAKSLGWGTTTNDKGEEVASTKVSRHEALRKIADAAWHIVLPTFIPPAILDQDSPGKDDLPFGKSSPFSEFILRDILDLTPSQQLELCSQASCPISRRARCLANYCDNFSATGHHR